MNGYYSHPVLDLINKFLGMGLSFRETLQLTDRAFHMKPGTARRILQGKEE